MSAILSRSQCVKACDNLDNKPQPAILAEFTFKPFPMDILLSYVANTMTTVDLLGQVTRVG